MILNRFELPVKMNRFIILIFFILSASVQAQDSYNYVKTYTAREAISGTITSITDENRVIQTIQYVDGLGRPTQSVIRRGSPIGHRDMVQRVTYDPYGRQDTAYLPFVPTTLATRGDYRADWSSEIRSFYGTSNDHATDENHFQQTVYEASPLSRITEHWGVGKAWRDADRNVTYGYQANTASEVTKWQLDVAEFPSKSGYYEAGELRKIQTIDEEGHQTIDFIDYLGRIVLKRVEANTSSATWFDTYYLYDEFGNLRYTLPPKVIAESINIKKTTTNSAYFGGDLILNDEVAPGEYFVPDEHKIKLQPGFRFSPNSTGRFSGKTGHPGLVENLFLDLAFQYLYDDRHRMTAKKVPGADWVYMVYDQWDRLVLTQDGEQRTKNEWIFTKYDALNRPIVTGIAHDTRKASVIQSSLEKDNTVARYETMVDIGNGTLDYSNNCYPNGTALREILTVTYYDSYNFSFASSNPYALTEVAGYVTADEKQESVLGMVTGQKTRILDGSGNWLLSVLYYDKKYRPIQTTSQNHLGGFDRVSTNYTFNGLPETIYSYHETSVASVTIKERFVYDQMDRLTSHYHQVGNSSEILLVSNSYNELGQLIQKDLKGSSSIAQSVDYTYNIRGWLTRINGGATSFDDASDKFGMELTYENSIEGHKYYNGNIGQLSWKSLDTGIGSNLSTQTYSYTYDPVSRLKHAVYTSIGRDTYFDVGGNDAGGINYDANGNILNLSRYMGVRNVSGRKLIDDLSYGYDPDNRNRLTGVTDAGDEAPFSDPTDDQISKFEDYGFYDDGGNTDYSYDRNGNLTRDANKGITNIEYNFLNLPAKVTLLGNMITYTYTATGVKLRSASDKVRDYIGPVHYEDNSLAFIQHPEGKVENSGSSWQYHFNLKDHLGNVRVTVDASGDVMQRDDYYSFGGTFNSYVSGQENHYKYQGKEEQDELDTYDFGWRMYDQWLGRTWQIDPHSENFYEWSPFSWAGNNPILMIDPTGMDWYQAVNEKGEVIEGGAVKWQEGSDAIEGYSNIGTSYSYRNGNVTYTYDQSDLSTIEEHVLDAEDWVSDRPDGTKTMQCFDAASQMVGNSDVTPGANTEENRIVLASESANEGGGYTVNSTGNTNTGETYLDSQIENGNSVLLGVNYKQGSVNSDNITDHWVALSSRITNVSTGSKSYTFYDPGTQYRARGTSSSNVLRRQSSGLFSGTTNYNGTTYKLSQIRRNN